MMFMVDPDILLLTVFATGASLWLLSTCGPSLRLCSCTPSMQRLSDRIMLVRGTDEVVGLYILNYSLLLLWGIASVLVEALFDNKNDMTSFFSAFLALIIGTLCALVHVLMPVRRRRIYSRAANEAVQKEEPIYFETVVGCVVELPDGSSALALHREYSDTGSEASQRKSLDGGTIPQEDDENSSPRIYVPSTAIHEPIGNGVAAWDNPVYIQPAASSLNHEQPSERTGSESPPLSVT